MRDKIIIGEVLKPQGIRGEIKIKPQLDSLKDIKKIKKVTVGGQEYKVLGARFDSAAVYLSLYGIADRNAAELLRRKTVEVLREDYPVLPQGKYFIVDIIGCEVVTEQGEKLGKITDVLSAHTDVYVMQNGEKEYMFPAAEGVVSAVDVEHAIVTVQEERIKQVLVEQSDEN